METLTVNGPAILCETISAYRYIATAPGAINDVPMQHMKEAEHPDLGQVVQVDEDEDLANDQTFPSAKKMRTKKMPMHVMRSMEKNM